MSIPKIWQILKHFIYIYIIYSFFFSISTAYEENDLEDVFSLNFAIVEDVFGETKTKELKPNGENISVTRENREEYVKLYCDYMLNKSVDRLYQAFHAGFHKGIMLKKFVKLNYKF